MEGIPDDIVKRVFSYLSSKERLIMREVCLSFKNNTKRNLVLSNKFDTLMKIRDPDNFPLARGLICYITYNNLTILKSKENECVHSLFRINNNYNKCINVICRERKLGLLYFMKKHILSYPGMVPVLYNRDIPYCSKCFKYWTLS